MNRVFNFLADPAHWQGGAGIGVRLAQHLGYSAITLVVAALIAIPLGAWIGHTGRGHGLVVNLVNGARSIPTLGLLFLAVLVLGPRIHGGLAFLLPAIVTLVVLAVPPILAGAYSGVEQVSPAVRDAAVGMGMTGGQLLREVELPCALPLIFSGLRSAALQVVATATVAASVGVGGLGRLLIDGQAARDYGQMAAGALLVAGLALLVDGAFAFAQRRMVSPGLVSGTRSGKDQSAGSADSAD